MTEKVDYYDETADWSLIPPHMHEGIHNYIMFGVPFGGFLTAIFSNDFMGAAAKADSTNLRCLDSWAMFLYNFVPSWSKGSPERVAAWIKSGGIVGQQKAKANG